MALHQFANDFFTLLGGDKTLSDLSKILDDELSNRRIAMVNFSISCNYQCTEAFDRNTYQKH